MAAERKQHERIFQRFPTPSIRRTIQQGKTSYMVGVEAKLEGLYAPCRVGALCHSYSQSGKFFFIGFHDYMYPADCLSQAMDGHSMGLD